MSVQVSYSKQTFVLILFIFLVLFIIEGITRTYDFFNPTCAALTNEMYDDVDYFFKSGICVSFQNAIYFRDPITGLRTFEPDQHSSVVDINNHGFRGSEISKEKPEDVYRIFMVGGSTVYGLYSSDETAIPGYLQTSFNQVESTRKIEVINTGIPGYTSSDELQLIKTKLIEYDPDLLIVYDGHNDLMLQAGYTHTIHHEIKYNFFEYYYKKYFSFYRTPYVFDEINKNINKEIFPQQANPAQYMWESNYIPGKKSSIWKNNILQICELGNENDIDVVYILQPFLITGNKTKSDFEMKMFQITKNPKLGYLEEFEHFLVEFDQLDSSCANTYNLGNIFDNMTETVYFDRSHIGYKNNKIVADKIFELTSPMIIN